MTTMTGTKMLKEERELRAFIRGGVAGWFNGVQITREAKLKSSRLITAMCLAVYEDCAKYIETEGLGKCCTNESAKALANEIRGWRWLTPKKGGKGG